MYTLTCTYRGVNLVLSRAGGSGRAKGERDRTEGGGLGTEGRAKGTGLRKGERDRTEEGRKGKD